MKAEDVTKAVRHLVLGINQMPTQERTKLILQIEEELKDLWFKDDDKVDGFVFKTKDLTQFKDMEGNRLLNENSVYIRKLAESISLSRGNVSPVIINEVGEKVDGQRRILAMRKYGLPFELTYIIRKGTTIDTVGDINQHQDKWNYKDWLHRYETSENTDYREYKDLADKYEHFMRSRSLRGLLMNNRVDPLKPEVWEKGEFTIDKNKLGLNIAYLEILKQVYLIGGKDNIFARDRNFQKALFEVYKNTKKMDVDRLLVKVRTGFGRLNIKTDFKTYKKILGEIYNSRLSGDKHHIVTQKAPEQVSVA